MLLAKILALPTIAHCLIRLAKRTPDDHLPAYMERFWLFNPYDRVKRKRRFEWLPISIRIHHILREDRGRHQHDHPWDARTFILCGSYIENRGERSFYRRPGDTATLNFDEYHEIISVSAGGVWTMFVMWKFKGVWGFNVNGTKIPHDEYGV